MADRAALIAIDQGTTSSRAIAFTTDGDIIALAQQEFPQIYPKPGWVEHDPEVIWATTLTTARHAMAEAKGKGFAPAAIGIANQRETTIVWDRKTGAPIHNAIVWQDRRTAAHTQRLTAEGTAPMVEAATGLVLDPYFSATKLAFILDAVPGARERAGRGELAFGTVDTFLIWRLTGGRVHATDATNASRTSLFDINRQDWSDDLMAAFSVPRSVLPVVRDSAADFGMTASDVFGASLPIRGVAGDQQAALIGQACFVAGDAKCTYGTGAFMVLNTGIVRVRSTAKLLSTVAYRIAGQTSYALEGSVLSAGATVQWLRDGLGLFSKTSEIEALARQAGDMTGLYLVPAFAGLGAPYWDPDARAALLGMTRGTGRAEIARAALESTVFQTRDLTDAMAKDAPATARLRIDGGMAANDWFMQRLADILAIPVVRPKVLETTALGAAVLAGLGAGLFDSLDAASRAWREDRTWHPAADPSACKADVKGWRDAIARVRTTAG